MHGKRKYWFFLKSAPSFLLMKRHLILLKFKENNNSFVYLCSPHLFLFKSTTRQVIQLPRIFSHPFTKIKRPSLIRCWDRGGCLKFRHISREHSVKSQAGFTMTSYYSSLADTSTEQPQLPVRAAFVSSSPSEKWVTAHIRQRRSNVAAASGSRASAPPCRPTYGQI